ncbi:DMT family transporter [Bhargavaea cecembensis]|uniref:DMT family transporter n=1 Tax=Bhargavaea cecembensis TaxID=394098 RepID=UPI000558EF1C|nr:DMT family transporter [Bhargavaea cecembensis]
MDKPPIHPYIPIMVGVITLAFSAIFVKLVSADAGVTAFYRMLFSVLVMAPAFLLKYRHEVKLISKKDWLFSVIAGVFLAFHFILWFESLNYTSVASSTVLVTLQPIFAFAGTYLFFKERLSVKTILSGLIAIGGSVLISWGDFQLGGEAFFGDMLALAACALITGYLLFGQDVRQRISLITYTFIVYSVSTIAIFFYVIAVGESFGPYPAMDWFWFAMLAILPNLFGHTLFNWSLRYVSTNVISIAILFEPVGAAVLAYYIFNETLIPTQIVGGLVVLAGITLFVLDGRKIRKLCLGKRA